MRRPFRSVGAPAGAVLVALVLALLPGCTAAPPGSPASASASVPVVPSGRDLPGWAHMVGFAADGSGFTLLANHRSRDGGRTWERTWTTGPDREPRTPAGSGCRYRISADGVRWDTFEVGDCRD